MLFKNLRYWSCLPLGKGAERSEAEGGYEQTEGLGKQMQL